MVCAQRKRGGSFRIHYCTSADAPSILNEGAAYPITFRRSPSINISDDFLIAPKLEADKGKLTVVLDLDETLVYARKGPLYVRPGMESLMDFLAEHCEAIVWTSSIHLYADAVINQIDPRGAVRHTIYRHPRWFRSKSATKDLHLLGRDLDSTIIIENTPDCLLGYEQNGVLVEDYEGGELEDSTLTAVLDLLKDLVKRRATEGITVSDYIRGSNRLHLDELPTNKGTPMRCYCLTPNEDVFASFLACSKRKQFLLTLPPALTYAECRLSTPLWRRQDKKLSLYGSQKDEF